MKEETLSAFNAKTHFGTLLDRVQSGEEIVITRRGKAVARIIPEGIDPRSERQRIAETVRSSRAEIATSLTASELRSLVEEGRRH